MTPYRVAITGCHRMLEHKPAGHNWAAAFAAVLTTKIVAVHDFAAETRERFASVWDVPAYEDYGKMLAQERPDIVCVATRQTLHAEQIEAAAAAGARGIVCEKPLATSMAEADRISQACERGNVRFLLGLDRRWMPYYRHIRGLLDEGVIGEVRVVASYGVPNLIAHGCHWFDMLAYFAGDAALEWVAGRVDEDRSDLRDPPGSGSFQLSNGVRAFIDSGAGSDVSFDLMGTSGRLTIIGDGADTRLWARDGKGPLSPRNLLASPPANDAPAAAVQDLVDAIEQGRPTACDISRAVRSLETGLAFHASHKRHGARVSVPLADRVLRVASLPWGNE
jgi:predicted dehydrogenase